MSNKKPIKTALILAAGNGTRLLPLTTKAMPKPYVPIAGKPLIGWIIDGLKKAGIERIFAVVNPKMGQLNDYLKAEGIELIFQKEAEGTAKAVLMAKDSIKEPFLIASGDHVMDYSIYKDLIDVWEGEDLIAVKFMKDVQRFGVIDIKCGKVVSAKEKPKDVREGFANLGIYIVNPSIFEKLSKVERSTRGEYEFTDVLKGFSAFTVLKPWLDVAYPWHLLDAFPLIMGQLEPKTDGKVIDSDIRGKVIIEEGAVVEHSVIEGPAYIGKGAHVGPFSYIRASMVGPNSYIGTGTSVVRSYLMEHVYAKHLSYIGDSVVAKSVNFGGGSITANLRLDRQPVKAYAKGHFVDTGREKLGAIIGENTSIGINASLMPGVVIEPDTKVLPGSVVKGYISSNDEEVES